MLVPRSIVNERTHEPCRWCAGASLTTCHSGRPKAGPWCVTYFLGTPTRQSIARTCMPAGLWEIHEGAARQAPIETVAPRFAHSRACVIVFPISDTPFANTRSPWNACARYPITWVPTWPSPTECVQFVRRISQRLPMWRTVKGGPTLASNGALSVPIGIQNPFHTTRRARQPRPSGKDQSGRR